MPLVDFFNTISFLHSPPPPPHTLFTRTVQCYIHLLKQSDDAFDLFQNYQNRSEHQCDVTKIVCFNLFHCVTDLQTHLAFLFTSKLFFFFHVCRPYSFIDYFFHNSLISYTTFHSKHSNQHPANPPPPPNKHQSNTHD